MLWCQGAQDIGLSNHENKSAQSAPYDHNARPSQTNRWTNTIAISRRFVLTNASRAKNLQLAILEIQSRSNFLCTMQAACC